MLEIQVIKIMSFIGWFLKETVASAVSIPSEVASGWSILVPVYDIFCTEHLQACKVPLFAPSLNTLTRQERHWQLHGNINFMNNDSTIVLLSTLGYGGML